MMTQVCSVYSVLVFALVLATAGAIQHMRVDSDLFTSEPSTSCPFPGQGKWEQMNQTRGTSRNMCVDGKLYPEFYSLGPPKTASTSMSIDLSGAGFECAAAQKEWQFWCEESNAGDHTTLTEKFRKYMPQCPGSERRVLADFAPQNLKTSSVVPPLLKSLYGTQSQKITFMLTPREPLSMVQSLYYFRSRAQNMAVPEGMFQEKIRGYLNALSDTKMSITWNGSPKNFEAHDGTGALDIDALVPFAMIGSQLKEWLESFGPKQFIVVPLRAYAKDPKHVCELIAQKTNYDIGCTDQASHKIPSDHPDLDTDLSPDLAKEFRDHMNSEKKLLLELLEDGHINGMTLPLYEGGALDNWLNVYW